MALSEDGSRETGRERRVADCDYPTGAAALSICESMLLCLVDLRVLSDVEVLGILEDAAAAHMVPGKTDEQTARGAAVATLIATIAAGNNSVRRRMNGPPKVGG
jgi:adenylosuccinate synthase